MKRENAPSSLKEAIEKFSPFLYKLAKDTWDRYSYKIVSYEDLLQSIYYLFIYSYKTYDPNRGNFKAYMKTVVTQKLNNMLDGSNPPWCKERPFSFLTHRKFEYTLCEDEDILDYLAE
ncbi:MAG: sigma factor [Pseudothermotoga sp.]